MERSLYLTSPATATSRWAQTPESILPLATITSISAILVLLVNQALIRIGDLAVHEGIFLAGITAMSPEAPNQAVIVDPTTGQLGSADVTPEYAIVTVFVDRGNGPSRWAFYSAPLGSPAGTTTGGVFRFSCSAAQAPCKISYGAAVVSDQSTANATIHPRLLINKR